MKEQNTIDLLTTIPNSPKVTREKKSKDFDTSHIRSPVFSRRSQKGEDTQIMKRNIFDLNTSCWSLKYQIEDNDFAKGAYGKVLLAKDKITGEKVVIKKIPQTTPIRMINNEVKAGKSLGTHDNIAALLQYIDKPDYHFLVFQFVSGADLFNHLERNNFAPHTESDARKIIGQILSALAHIHSRNIAHRDIKLENILIDKSGKVTVIDLGLCAFIDEGKHCRDWCGSDNYLAPEIVRRVPYCGYKADVFSTGVVLFALIYGVFPFENLRVNGPVSPDGSRFLKKLNVRFPSDVKVSNSVKDLLAGMLCDDPEQRISLLDVLQHEWVVGDKKPESSKSFKMSCESTVQAY